MVDGIATALGGLQKAAARADTAARAIASYGTQGGPTDTVSLSAEALASGGLEGAVVMMKTAAIAYKANAEALSSMLEMQAQAFEELI